MGISHQFSSNTSVASQQKTKPKLISKMVAKNNQQLDHLAVEFDSKLTLIMVNLADQLKNPLLSDSQKWVKIETCKFDLLNYCNETATDFLKKNKNHIMIKDAKELSSIFSKIKEAMNKCFNNQTTLFHNKRENEVYDNCLRQISAFTSEKEQVMRRY